MKRFKSFILLCLAIAIFTACGTSSNLANAYYVEYQQEQFGYEDLRAVEDRMNEQTNQMQAAHQMAEAARALGYDDSHSIIQTAKREYADARKLYLDYKAIHDDLELHWRAKESEYPTAAYIWSYLKDLGYSDAVVAGIMGNLMAETGGHTLALKWNSQTPSYYGICQWNKNYSEIWGASLEGQCNFLRDTIKYELNTFGYMYKKGFSYDTFLTIQNPKDAALAFAKSYERCGSDTYKLRQECAVEAYNYFVA